MLALLETLLKNFAPAILKPDPHTPESSPHASGYVAVRSGYELKTVENKKAPAPGRRHKFYDVASFASFVKKHMPNSNKCEILAGTVKIVAVDAAEYWRDEVSCDVALDPQFVAWKNLLGRQTTQARLYRELVPLSGTITGPFITALSQLDITQATEASYKLNEHGGYDVLSKRATTNGTAKLPAKFVVNVPVYLDTEPVAITLAVGIDTMTAGQDPTFTLIAVDLDKVWLAEYRKQVDALRVLLGDKYLVGMGEVALS